MMTTIDAIILMTVTAVVSSLVTMLFHWLFVEQPMELKLMIQEKVIEDLRREKTN